MGSLKIACAFEFEPLDAINSGLDVFVEHSFDGPTLRYNLSLEEVLKLRNWLDQQIKSV